MSNSVVRVTPPSPGMQRRSKPAMKLIACVIRAERLETVRTALSRLNLVGGATLTDVRGFGRQRGAVEHYMSVPYMIRYNPKVKLEIVVSSEDVETVTTLISQ